MSAPSRKFLAVLAVLGAAFAAGPALAAGGLEIFPQPVPLVVLIVLFTLLIWPANELLWKPLLRVLEARRASIAGTRARAEKIAAEAEDIFTTYEAAVERARIAADTDRAKVLEGARREQGEVTRDARRSAENEVAAAREAVGAALGRARTEIQGAARELGRDAATRVLGRPVS